MTDGERNRSSRGSESLWQVSKVLVVLAEVHVLDAYPHPKFKVSRYLQIPVHATLPCALAQPPEMGS
jgi:hypothetical protein